jgi:tyrosyl-tRNA synthetase
MCPSTCQGHLERLGGQAGLAQRRLAEEVTRFVHGEDGLQQALAATAVRSNSRHIVAGTDVSAQSVHSVLTQTSPASRNGS